MNLVVNGRDAMQEGGILSIETGNVDLNARPFVMLRVRDTGVGIDPQTRQLLFEPFFTTKHAGLGTGLGLSTVFGIVTQSGGQISVESDPGHGAEFTVFLPRTSGSPKVKPDRPAQGGLAEKSGLILVVEDQEEVRALSCAVLRTAGYEVLEASDGLEAILLTRNLYRPVQLLLTDVIMPGMNGRELAAGITIAYPEIKVIFMSGYADQIMSDNGILDGSVEFLQKPFTPTELVARVRQVLAR
jgi:two-component system cell cycle sensor histidine kinase/response regulator CckA